MRLLLVVIAFFTVACAGVAAHGQARIGEGKHPAINAEASTVSVKYHEFLLLKYDGNVIALHLMPDPRFGFSGINYRWYHLADGSDKFYLPINLPDHQKLKGRHVIRPFSPPPNLSLKVGSGDADEGISGMGDITAGPLSITWSMGDHDGGWIYLLSAKKTVLVYPVQFKTLHDVSGMLDPEKWQPANVPSKPEKSDASL